MSINREQLHDLIDIVDVSEYDVIYRVLTKFIPEDIPSDDEIEAIKLGQQDFKNGNFANHNEIDWS